MKKPVMKNLRILAVAAIFLQAIFISCSKNVTQYSVTSALDQIDALINQNQYKEAEKELGKLEKNAFGAWTSIGIFRRYSRMSLLEKAEKSIVQAIKANPENLELNAVYTNFLLKQNRIPEAVKAGKILQGTKYGSIYSESILKDTLSKFENDKIKEVFNSIDYYPVYYDAYRGTKDNAWLRNCALLKLSSGAFADACKIKPAEIYGAEDAYFWALVTYDGNCFADSVNYAELAKKLYPVTTGKKRQKLSSEKIVSLIGDSYLALNDVEKAEEVRSEYLTSIKKSKGYWNLGENSEEETYLPIMFVNSAKWAKDNNELEKCAELLRFCVDNWKDYVPGLIGYADFAYNSSLVRKEDSETMELRDAGLATLEMEKYDNRAKLPLSDAVFRIEESLKRVKNSLLYIVRLDLKYKTEPNFSEKQKKADIWRILEENMLKPSVYEENLFDYAENFFLTTKNYDDAWKLFYKYIANKYSIKADNTFWDGLILKIHEISQKELEYAAYFATLSLRINDSLCLYESAVFESGNKNQISALVDDKSCANLAMIYYSVGNKNDALDLYGRITGRTTDIYLRSLAMYRMALIYYKDDDIKNARRCAEYAVSLNKKNTEARFLLAKIKQL